MLEIICIVSQDAQREIITCIPEVVDDSEHNVIAYDMKYVISVRLWRKIVLASRSSGL